MEIGRGEGSAASSSPPILCISVSLIANVSHWKKQLPSKYKCLAVELFLMKNMKEIPILLNEIFFNEFLIVSFSLYSTSAPPQKKSALPGYRNQNIALLLLEWINRYPSDFIISQLKESLMIC